MKWKHGQVGDSSPVRSRFRPFLNAVAIAKFRETEMLESEPYRRAGLTGAAAAARTVATLRQPIRPGTAEADECCGLGVKSLAQDHFVRDFTAPNAIVELHRLIRRSTS